MIQFFSSLLVRRVCSSYVYENPIIGVWMMTAHRSRRLPSALWFNVSIQLNEDFFSFVKFAFLSKIITQADVIDSC